MELCSFYCLSYKNEERRAKMTTRFNVLNLKVHFYEGVNFDDDRLLPLKNNLGAKKCWTCTYGHLDMIHTFLNESKEYGVFCEDDVYLHKNLAYEIPNLIHDFKTMKLDILLLGYLTQNKPQDSTKRDINGSHIYYNYSDDLWGAQMYMISRSYATYLIDTYYYGYAEKSLKTELKLKPFSSDFTITKDGNKALVFPMYAVEDGLTHYDHPGQERFHQNSFRFNYIETLFI